MKKWFTSQTIWSDIATGIVVAWNALAGQFGFPTVPEYIIAALAAWGLYGRTKANQPINWG